MPVPAHTLVLGGQKSGKSRHAECQAAAWLAQPGHEAVLLATAQDWDDEMQVRIAQHRRERAQRVPEMRTVEEPLQLAEAIAQHSAVHRLIVVDCLTLWLTNWLMPHGLADADAPAALLQRRQRLHLARQAVCEALRQAPGPVTLVSNEMGWGVMPLGRAVRAFADELGMLNQAVAAQCQRVRLLVAGHAVDVRALAEAVQGERER